MLNRLEHKASKVTRTRQPIESSTIDLTAESDEDSLAAQEPSEALSVKNVKPITILQRVGDVVVVPGCVPHQVN